MHAFCMYVSEKFREKLTERVYRNYVADSLRAIPRGEYLEKRYSELFEKKPDFDPREVVDRVTERAGLAVMK